jgi:hypothetical protein
MQIPSIGMETLCFSETLVSTYESTRRHNPEEQNHLNRRENLKSHKLVLISNASYIIHTSHNISTK